MSEQGDLHDHAHAHTHGHDHGGSGSTAAPELAGIVAALGTVRGRALDVGCGAGADVTWLAQAGFDAIGVDADQQRIDAARERARAAGVGVELHCASATDMPLADASVDIAFDRGCLHHVPVDEQPAYVAEVARVLRAGARMYLRDAVHPGHFDTPVNEQGMTRLVAGLPLEVELALPFTMHGHHGGPTDATIVVLRRT